MSAADVDRALTQERSLLISSLNRGTLHLVASEDYPWLHSLLTPPLMTTSATRLAQEGIDPGGVQRGLAVIERALADEGPLTRHELRERLRRAGLRTEGQALIHLLFRATLEGISVRGPVIGQEHAYVLVRDWLPAPRLLGAFEPLLMGWSSRADVLADAESAIVSGGIFRGFALGERAQRALPRRSVSALSRPRPPARPRGPRGPRRPGAADRAAPARARAADQSPRSRAARQGR